jgi:hypothetical protein
MYHNTIPDLSCGLPSASCTGYDSSCLSVTEGGLMLRSQLASWSSFSIGARVSLDWAIFCQFTHLIYNLKSPTETCTTTLVFGIMIVKTVFVLFIFLKNRWFIDQCSLFLCVYVSIFKLSWYWNYLIRNHEDWTQGQTFLPREPHPQTFLFVFCFEIQFHKLCPSWPWTCAPPASAYQLSGIIGMYHCIQHHYDIIKRDNYVILLFSF